MEEPKTLLEETLAMAEKLRDWRSESQVDRQPDTDRQPGTGRQLNTDTDWASEMGDQDSKELLSALTGDLKHGTEDNEIGFQIIVKPSQKQESGGDKDMKIPPLYIQKAYVSGAQQSKTGKPTQKRKQKVKGNSTDGKIKKKRHKQGSNSALAIKDGIQGGGADIAHTVSGVTIKKEIIEDTLENTGSTEGEGLNNTDTDNTGNNAVKKHKMFSCSRCPASFTRKERMMGHMRKVHNEDVKVQEIIQYIKTQIVFFIYLNFYFQVELKQIKQMLLK